MMYYYYYYYYYYQTKTIPATNKGLVFLPVP
jgi:hypothetical protein